MREHGLVKRLTLIERYYFKGWLKYGDKRLDDKIRLDCANRLASDFFFSRFPSNAAIDWQKERVDGGFDKSEPERVLDARDRFFKAIRCIPSEFWGVVQSVVLNEQRPKFNDGKFANECALYTHKIDLCRGLDRLAWHYGVKPLKNKILSSKPTEQPTIKNKNYFIVVDK